MNSLFEASFMPHGHCYLWRPEILWLHVGSDALIALAYFSIPAALITLVRRRSDLAFSGAFRLFGAFIFLCGLTHVFSIWTTWQPVYTIEGVVKLATAGVSIATAAMLWPLLPQAVALPSQTQLEEANRRLQEEIAQRHRAEEELRSLMETLEERVQERTRMATQIAEAASSGMLLVDESGTILRANSQVQAIFGYSEQELQGSPVERLVPSEARGKHPQLREQFTANPTPRAMGSGRDLFGMHRDGGLVPVEIGLTPIQSEQGPLVLASIVDITQRKQNEAELHSKAAELARSNRDLEEFAYIVSHDLKEPLRGMRTYSSLLLQDFSDGLNGEGRRMLDTVGQLAQRLDSLLDAVLQYSRMGRQDESATPCDLAQVVHEVLERLGPSLDTAGADVRVEPLPRVMCDHVPVAEVFHNLVANALKYNDKPQAIIEIGWQPAPGEGTKHGQDPQWPVFYVRDNGIGIQENQHEVIFRMFRRLHRRDAYGGGVGAGLAIVKKIVERHGGSLRVESTVGEGTTFWFTLGPVPNESPSRPAPNATARETPR